MQSLWLLLATFAATCGFALTKAVDPAVAFFDILFVRSAFMLVVAGGGALIAGIPLGTRHPWLHAARAAAGFSALSLNIIVVRHLPLAVSQTLIFMAPLFVTLCTLGRSFVRGRRPDLRLAFVVALGFAGVLLVYRPASGSGAGIYMLLGVVSAMLAACTGLILKRLGGGGEPVVRTVFIFSAAGLLLSGAAVGLFSDQDVPGLFTDPLLLAIGFTSAVSHLAQAQGWGKGRPMLCACLQFSPVPFAALLDAFVFNAVPGGMTLLGIAVVILAEISGVLLVHGEGRRSGGGRA